MTTQDGSANVRLTATDSIAAVIEEMTLLEKARLCGGALPFETHGVERLGIPRLLMTDGHNGINSHHLLGNHVHRVADRLGLDKSRIHAMMVLLHEKGADGIRALASGVVDAAEWAEELDAPEAFVRGVAEAFREELPEAGLPSCFPPGIVMGATWDPDLIAECGAAVAAEARAFGLDILLGPNVNIHRDPLCGRAFESYSEDPHLSAEIGVGYIRGVQEEGVAAVVKHYVANNQEHERLGVDEQITQRALREVYFPSFRRAIVDGDCWMVMSAYNKVNGTACALNRWLLTEVLREEWGFSGFVVSDWGAAYDRIEALRAGNDLAMPGPLDPQQIVDAVESGRLDESVLDERVRCILGVMLRLPAFAGDPKPALDRKRSMRVARKVAAEGVVLLKNDAGALPVCEGRVAVFGENSTAPIATGTGSAGVVSPHEVSVLEGLAARFGEENVTFGELPDDAALAVICVGAISGEGRDRESLDLAPEDVGLILDVGARCREAGTPSVVILNVCGPVTMADWVDEVDAVLLGWLGGMEMGNAVAAVLAGDVCPSGKLPLTFPRRRQDTPAFLNFPGEFGRVVYGEGIFVGYRYYDTADVAPQYPFGHGLSYTTFELSGLAVSADTLDLDARGKLSVSVDVANTGGCRGKEVVQLYVRHEDGTIRKPDKELRGFAKVDLGPGEATTVRFEITGDALAHYDGRREQWCVEPDAYEVLVGVSSRDIRSTANFKAEGTISDKARAADGDVIVWSP